MSYSQGSYDAEIERSPHPATPRVTVIIPNFNHEPFLEKRINSVLNQTFQDFEIIYLDDASTDESGRVFEQFSSNPRIRPVLNKLNSGSSFSQWNKGVRLARGEYIWIAESDDYADREFLSKLIEVLDKHANVGLAYCRSQLVDEHGSVETWNIGKRWEEDFHSEGADECRNQLLFNNTIPNASAVLFRRCLYEKAGYADESMVFCGDWLMWVKILLLSDVAFISAPLNYYRRHSGSVSARMSASLKSFGERYRVVGYINENLQLSEKDLEQACESLMGLWSQIVLLPGGKKDWRANLRIYKSAREVDPRIKYRIARRLLVLFLATFRLIAPIRFAKRILRYLLPAASDSHGRSRL